MPFFKYPVRRFRHRPLKSVPAASAPSIENEIDRLISTLSDVEARKGFQLEMQCFTKLLARYEYEKSQSSGLDWDKISVPAANKIVPYDGLLRPADLSALKKLAVLKVNGGLGTSMGMKGAKSALEVSEGLTFLDLTVQQVQHLNTTHMIDTPLILMTSFNTYEDTIRVIRKYANQQLHIITFNQSRFPRVFRDTLLPCPKSAEDDNKTWYPPGHGDLFTAIYRSGVLEQLLSEGKEYLFVSNSDNLGATVDGKILQHMIDSDSEFLMEVTDRTKADIKGGTLVEFEGSIRLLELGHVPVDRVEEFQSVKKFKSFNTNNLWIDLKAVKRLMESGDIDLDIIENVITMDNGRSALQLETAAGCAIKFFKNAHGVNVSRKRFLPVKNCSDLLLIKSDIYNVENGQLIVNENRSFHATPTIKLSDHFRKIDQFQRRFKTIPRIGELDHLTVTGDVYFGRSVTLCGTVIVAATEGQRIDIPDGCVLENRLIAGNLNMIEL